MKKFERTLNEIIVKQRKELNEITSGLEEWLEEEEDNERQERQQQQEIMKKYLTPSLNKRMNNLTIEEEKRVEEESLQAFIQALREMQRQGLIYKP